MFRCSYSYIDIVYLLNIIDSTGPKQNYWTKLFFNILMDIDKNSIYKVCNKNLMPKNLDFCKNLLYVSFDLVFQCLWLKLCFSTSNVFQEFFCSYFTWPLPLLPFSIRPCIVSHMKRWMLVIEANILHVMCGKQLPKVCSFISGICLSFCFFSSHLFVCLFNYLFLGS